MKKIPSAFKRDYNGDRQIYDERVEGTEWISGPEAVATEKFDGTACLVKDGKLFKRYDAKKGKTPPAGFVPAMEPDPITGHWAGWLPVTDKPEDQWHRAGIHAYPLLPDGTYELVGPKVGGNPYGLCVTYLWSHGSKVLENVPTDFEGLRIYLAAHPEIEGIVWHHPDGDMAKIKRKDFLLPWPPKKGE